MVITYGGKALVRVQNEDTVLVMNPPAEVGGKKLPKSGADIGFISVRHLDFANDEALSYGERTPVLVAGPGEYEIGGVYVRGIGTGVFSFDGRQLSNTAFTMLLDGMVLCHLGGVLPATLEPAVREQFGAVDVVFVPVTDTAGAKDAYRIASSLMPSIIIPLDLSPKGDALEAFLKEAGDSPAPVDKLTLKKKDLEGSDDTKIIVLEPFL
jgi:L-ascorbate metabolism protein UlaG (beta-lactamase superfamily)